MKLWKHTKSGRLYVEIGRGKYDPTFAQVVIYQSTKTQEIWVRPQTEFDDGRFVEYGESDDKPGT